MCLITWRAVSISPYSLVDKRTALAIALLRLGMAVQVDPELTPG